MTCKSRVVTVTGPRGSLTRSFKHVSVDMAFVDDGAKLRLDMWFGNPKQKAAMGTVLSHITNMITGVTQGYRYKMRLVYSHFPINVSIEKDGKQLAIRNFLGEKVLREVDCLGDVKIERSKVKDELVIEGTDVDLTSRTCALIHQICLVKNKDIRKFLDGIYVSEKGPIPVEED